MSIIIRPSPGVFKRTMPLVIVFGAYRRFKADPQLDAADLDTITTTVEIARTARMPLAFCRCVVHENGADAGVWLPGCRPKVTDRVFDHATGSAFASAAFTSVFNNITDRQIFVVGPRGDSSMRATVRDSSPLDRDVRVVIPDHPLQKCSTMINRRPCVVMMSSYSDHHSEVAFGNWKDTMLHCNDHH